MPKRYPNTAFTGKFILDVNQQEKQQIQDLILSWPENSRAILLNQLDRLKKETEKCLPDDDKITMSLGIGQNPIPQKTNIRHRESLINLVISYTRGKTSQNLGVSEKSLNGSYSTIWQDSDTFRYAHEKSLEIIKKTLLQKIEDRQTEQRHNRKSSIHDLISCIKRKKYDNDSLNNAIEKMLNNEITTEGVNYTL